jgi:hypothetical protein
MRSFDASYVEENLRGWKWNPNTANWVEPTSYALLFLKKSQQLTGSDSSSVWVSQGGLNVAIAEAESLLRQRMCTEGGWNYGNAKVLGEELRAYPLTTAIALIALQHPSSSECQRSLAYLERAMESERSGLALCMAVNCFSLYDMESERWMQAAAGLYDRTRYFQNIKTCATALLALQSLSGNNAFRLASRP